jgi:hypothetical protein
MFGGIRWDFLQINEFEMSPILTILLSSISSSLICTIFNTLEKRD